MNTLVKKLAEQAGFTEWHRMDNPNGDAVIQALAELIVKECVGVCNGRHHTWRWDDEDDSLSGPRDCANSIKRHFGVEE